MLFSILAAARSTPRVVLQHHLRQLSSSATIPLPRVLTRPSRFFFFLLRSLAANPARSATLTLTVGQPETFVTATTPPPTGSPQSHPAAYTAHWMSSTNHGQRLLPTHLFVATRGPPSTIGDDWSPYVQNPNVPTLILTLPTTSPCAVLLLWLRLFPPPHPLSPSFVALTWLR
jgi:hypothetical protein